MVYRGTAKGRRVTDDPFAEFKRLLAEMQSSGAMIGPIMMMARSTAERQRDFRRRQQANLYVARCDVDGKMVEWMLDAGVLSEVNPDRIGQAVLDLAKAQMIALKNM